ncbi:siderophore ABC transporter substrate-binding protein [Brevibacterium album]|uniref:siderophore ABC transporter substrate-binding protein n=1 Tax=Brevibacterium album TaxID=417948 RepID=UPI0003F64752|nr:ABC transporter substrate-binding protein [Brevibacterium album]
MIRRHRRLPVFLASAAALTLGLTACGSASADEEDSAAGSGETASTVTVESNGGPVEVTTPPESVVALDNTTFRLLDTMGVELSAGAVSLMPDDLSYQDAGIPDVGSHREPDLEQIVAAEPDLVIGGYRFSDYEGDIKSLAPDAAYIDITARDGEDFSEELKRQATVLGEIFDKEDEAAQIVADYDESVERVKAAYDPEQSVMGVITSGGDINYSAPGVGRTLGPVFDALELTPSLEVDDSSTDHQGDDISVEAIADSNPDWILVMDRDAGVNGGEDGEEYTPANELIADSAALQNVSAVQEDHIVYMPQFTYVDEGIQNYTEFFNSVADAMEASS